jgi:chromosome segregation ATPase
MATIAELKASLEEKRERLADLKDRQQRLALDTVCGSAEAEEELSGVEKEVAETRRTIERTELAIRELACQSAEQGVQARENAMRRMTEMVPVYETELEEGLQNVMGRVDPLYTELDDVVHRALRLYQLKLDLFRLTGERRYRPQWDIGMRLGVHAGRLSYFRPGPRPKPRLDTKPWAADLEILKQS